MKNERYSRLFALTKNLYTESAPVVIAAGALLKDNQTGKVLAQVKFKNISSKKIKALKAEIKAFDVAGAELQGVSEYQYLDLSVARDEEFGQKNAIVLPDAVTRSFTAKCTSVIFTDGTQWEDTSTEWVALAKQETLFHRLGVLRAQYRRDTTKQAEFVVTDDRDLWLCACSAINHTEEDKCHACHNKKEKFVSALEPDSLKERNDAYYKAESERKEKQAAEEKAKKAKSTKVGIIVGAIALVVIATILVVTLVVVPTIKYNSAVRLMDKGEYENAIVALEELGEYKDSLVLLDKARTEKAAVEKEEKNQKDYQVALDLLESGEYDAAVSAFEKLGKYKDSADMITESVYQKAISLLSGESSAKNETLLKAYNLFKELGDYKESVGFLSKIKARPIAEENYYGKDYENFTVTHYVYNEKGLLEKKYSDTSEEVYIYDDGDNLVQSKGANNINDEFWTWSFIYDYDINGNIIKSTIEWSDSNYYYEDAIYEYEYDYAADGKINSFTWKQSEWDEDSEKYILVNEQTFIPKYDEFGNRIEDSYTYTYDEMGNIIKSVPSDETYASTEYVYEYYYSE